MASLLKKPSSMLSLGSASQYRFLWHSISAMSPCLLLPSTCFAFARMFRNKHDILAAKYKCVMLASMVDVDNAQANMERGLLDGFARRPGVLHSTPFLRPLPRNHSIGSHDSNRLLTQLQRNLLAHCHCYQSTGSRRLSRSCHDSRLTCPGKSTCTSYRRVKRVPYRLTKPPLYPKRMCISLFWCTTEARGQRRDSGT